MKLLLIKSYKTKKNYYSLKWIKKWKREIFLTKYGKITLENEKNSFKTMLITS